MLLQYIRVLEIVTYSILEGKYNLEKSHIEEPFRILENNVKNLNYYEIIRLYAIIANLNI